METLTAAIVGGDPRVKPDARDENILRERVAALMEWPGPVCGDWVIFANGKERRISHAWEWEDEPDSDHTYQTSDGGSWHFCSTGRCSFSGGLFPGVKRPTLSSTGERRLGRVWFFHHDHYTASNAVIAEVPFRVWHCTEEAPR